ncbi:MAG: hypothetical protein IPF53_22420 [Blastocatellia bacterium]|nr:hypothetical protein [Blastocatellia bacterium]MBK6426102.1 hypothetical protein [Blastocatellia bacterium]
MKSIVVLSLSVLLLVPAAAFGQSRGRKPAPKKPAPKPAASAVELERKAGVQKVSDQIKTLGQFLYLYGGVVKTVERIEGRAERRRATNPEVGEVAEQNKQAIRQSISNVRAGLETLENEFSSKPSLRPYYSYVVGVTAIGVQAESAAAADDFDQAGRILVTAIAKLSDALVRMRDPIPVN